MTDSNSQEYIAALGLKEIPIESKNTTGTANPCTRCLLSDSSSTWSGATSRCRVAYQEIDTNSRLARAALERIEKTIQKVRCSLATCGMIDAEEEMVVDILKAEYEVVIGKPESSCIAAPISSGGSTQPALRGSSE